MANFSIPSTEREKAELLFHEGNHQLAQGDFAAAEVSFRTAVELDPDFGQALTNLAYVLDHGGDLAQAELMYRRAQAAGVDAFELHMNLGVLLATQKRFDEAEMSYSQALRCNPEVSAVWSNLGVLYLGLKREPEAEAHLQQALALDPANAKAQFNLSYLYLRNGQFEAGWRCLEARDWYAALAKHFTCPRWSGESLAGKSLVIGYEAGHGDVIQFARYVPILKALGARAITLICHPALKDVLQTLDGITTVQGFDEDIALEGWDYWTPLMSIAHHLKTRADTIPAQIPYLRANVALVKHWAALLPVGKVRVGLVWQGNPRFENDAERSLASIRLLAPLWQVSGVTFVSLQKGAGEAELTDLEAQFPLTDLGSKVASFSDTAAIVAGLDLVICVDTAVAHLAGALGKPCWVLLPDYMTDWRWGREGASSAWYPQQMRLFRQRTRGDWPWLVQEVATALDLFARQH